MDNLSLRAILILVGAFLMCFAVFATQGVPFAQGGVPVDSNILATWVAGAYALTSLAAIVLARAILGLFIDFARPVVFFQALANITDPFLALFGPITPGFLHPAARPFYAAFCLFFIKMLIFGAFGAPSPMLLLALWLALG